VTRRSLGESLHYLRVALLLELALYRFSLLRGRLLLGTAAACLFFFRDPDRPVGSDPDTIYASADGVIADVEIVSDEWLPGDALRIGTFLALYDVHVNRSPARGTITLAEEAAGGFAPAFARRATENYRKRLAIDDGDRRVILVQVAGMVARRISSWAWLGDPVETGDRIAIIHFGSRTEVLLPATEARVAVAPGQRVRAGVTPIARYVEQAART
jgi:phosphatidylserine decarboxylase